jgi:hypothetical protein
MAPRDIWRTPYAGCVCSAGRRDLGGSPMTRFALALAALMLRDRGAIIQSVGYVQ